MDDRLPVKCMVVDDDHDGAEVVGEFLKALGAEVKVVYGGQQAIDIAPHFEPRMVVLDLNMPTIDGFETCRRLRQQGWSHHVVIVAYTGLPAPKAILMAAGFDHLVTKGDPPEIFETILKSIAP
jgi:CheY-like chemotaxis protein